MFNDVYKNIKPYKQVKKSIVVLSTEDINKLLSSQNEFTIIGLKKFISYKLNVRAGCVLVK